MTELLHRTNGLRIAWSPIMRNYDSSGNRESVLRGIFQVNSILGEPIMQALKLFATASDGAVSPEKAQKNKLKWLIGLIMAVAFLSVPALAQEKNEVGLVIGGIVTPSQTLSPGVSLIGPGGTVLPNRDITFDSSLTLGAEYDRTFVLKQKFAIDGGADFLASPFDVKVSQQSQNAIGQYAFIFLTPHVRVKFHPNGVFSPWLSFGGGYARFLEKAPSILQRLTTSRSLARLCFKWDRETAVWLCATHKPLSRYDGFNSGE
jgi:hypothetical protein